LNCDLDTLNNRGSLRYFLRARPTAHRGKVCVLLSVVIEKNFRNSQDPSKT